MRHALFVKLLAAQSKLLRRYMSCGYYTFTSFSTSGYGILVQNKDIKDMRMPDRTKEIKIDPRDTQDSLSSNDVQWLHGQIGPDFRPFQIHSLFVLLLKKDDVLIKSPILDVEGPDDIWEENAELEIEEAPIGHEYDKLVEIARKLTPPCNKLSFPPGRYSFSMVYSDLLKVRELEPSEEDERKQEALKVSEEAMSIPLDFDIIVGEGEKQKTIKANKAILACYLPNFDSLVGDVTQATKMELPDADPKAVETALVATTTREKNYWPCRYYDEDKFKPFEQVLETFGFELNYGKIVKKVKTNHYYTFHPALHDPKWLDVTFVVGPDKTEVHANRAVLASTNPVLHRILYGTETVPVDPLKPIEWLEFDEQAVRCVFSTLVQREEKEVEVPEESVDSARALVDYLKETRDGLKLFYAMFERGFGISLSRYRRSDGDFFEIK